MNKKESNTRSRLGEAEGGLQFVTERAAHSWRHIEDLSSDISPLAEPDLVSLGTLWGEQSKKLKESASMERFLTRMRRELAIETGIIERLYTIDRGITQTLIEHGVQASLIPHGATDRPAEEVVAIIH